MAADEALFCDADGGQAGQHAQVAGDAESARMGQALAVADEQVRQAFEFLQCRENRRRFPKGKQSRHVGKAGRQGDEGLLTEFQPWKSQHHDGGAGEPVIPVETHVDAGHRADRSQPVAGLYQPAQPSLRLAGLGGGYVPGMLVVQLQHRDWRSIGETPDSGHTPAGWHRP